MTNDDTCKCAHCGPSCACEKATPAEGRCCCGDRCTCGPSCRCGPSCGCPGARRAE